jgi:hypothetical protein
MRALLEIQKLGYRIDLDGEWIKLTWSGEGTPDPTVVRPILEEIKRAKEEVVQYLRQNWIGSQHDSENKVSNLSLNEFTGAPLAVRIWSKSLKREIWFVSDEQAIREFGIEGIYFTADELERLVRMKLTSKDLETLVDIKAILGGEII